MVHFLSFVPLVSGCFDFLEIFSSFDFLFLSLIQSKMSIELTLYNVCAVPWGCSVLGGYHEYRGGIS